MKFLSLFLILSSLVSCGMVNKEQVKKVEINEQMEPYYQRFSELYGKDVDDLEMKFANSITNSNPNLITLGYCQRSSKTVFTAKKTYVYETPVVVINKSAWDKMDVLSRERLILHELGHCILNRGHDDTKINVDNQHPVYKSLMSTYANNNFDSYSNLISELFGRPQMTGVSFESYRYASTTLASTAQDEELEDVVLPDLHDCTHDKGHEVIDQREPASVEEK